MEIPGGHLPQPAIRFANLRSERTEQCLGAVDRRTDQLLYTPQIPFAHAALNKQASGNAPGTTGPTIGDKHFHRNRSKRRAG
jgi:hypothetical protein